MSFTRENRYTALTTQSQALADALAEVERLKEDAMTYKRMHCACVFDGDNNTEQCKLHAAWCDTLHEQGDMRRERDTLRTRLAKAEAELAAIHAQPVVGFLEYARKKPTLRDLVFTKSSHKDLMSAGWISNPLITKPTKDAP